MSLRLELVALVALGALALAAAGGGCEREGPCRCRAAAGLLDLEPAMQSDFYETASFVPGNHTYEATQYFFHPCKDASLDKKDVPNTCNAHSICKREVEIKSNNGTVIVTDNHYLGLASVTKTTFSYKEGGDISIIYSFEAVTATVHLVCTKYSNNNFVITHNNPNALEFIFYSPHACLIPTATSQHSLGTTLLIIFFVIVMMYLLTGVCVKHFLMGARGIEIIPNLNFWKELPSLVRDGVTFVQNGFKPPAQTASTPNQNPNPNSYDSI